MPLGDTWMETLGSSFMQGFSEGQLMALGSTIYVVELSFEGVDLNVQRFESMEALLKYVEANDTPGTKLTIKISSLQGEIGGYSYRGGPAPLALPSADSEVVDAEIVE